MTDTTLDLDTLTLARGKHGTREEGVCLMEAVAAYAGREHTDHPPCVCPVLGNMGRSLNDTLPDDRRQALVPLIPVVVGTADDGMSERRGLMACDWIVRTYTPTWLRLAGLEDEASALEDLPEITDGAGLETALPALNAARAKAAAARDAARDAAAAAAWDAARDAAWDAAWGAARAASWDAAWTAARAAARGAARDALDPTVEALQQSAVDLCRRMAELRPITPTEEPDD